MQRVKSRIFHKLFVVLLTVAALFTGTAWLANFRFPLAVLQTIGVVDTVRLEGVKRYWYLILRDDINRESTVSLSIFKNVLTIEVSNLYSEKQKPEDHQYVRLGFAVFRTRASDFSPTNPIRDRLPDGTPAPRLSERSSTFDIAVWFLWPLFAAYPLWSLVRGPLTLRHRRKHDLCLNCGYSLKQLTEPRCPECGCEIEPTTST